MDEEVKNVEKDLGAKCELIMLIDVVTAGETNDFSFFFATGGIKGV